MAPGASPEEAASDARVHGAWLTPCVYCGMVATTRDHLIPQTYRDRTPDWRNQTVPACHECNSLLGAAFEFTVKARRAVIHQKLQRRYSKLLRMPDWTQAELRRLGEISRREIESALAKKQEIVYRLRWHHPYKLPKQPQRLQCLRCSGRHETTGDRCWNFKTVPDTVAFVYCWIHHPERIAERYAQRRARREAARMAAAQCESLTKRGVRCLARVRPPRALCPSHTEEARLLRAEARSAAKAEQAAA